MANKPISEKEQLAWDFAKLKHTGQIRKFINLPYFDAHVQKVNGILKQYSSDEDLLCASILHDVIEDSDTTYEELYELFGKRVADLVDELTSHKEDIDGDYGGNKADYLIDKMISMSDDALIIKLCDRLQNISDAFTATDKFRYKYYLETVKILDEVKRMRRLNKIQLQLANDIDMKLDNIKNMFYNESFRIKRFNDFKK